MKKRLKKIKLKKVKKFINIVKIKNYKCFKIKFIFKLYFYKYFFFYYKKKKIIKKIEKNLSILLNKIFYPFFFKVFLKIKLTKKKVKFLKFFYLNVIKHNFFKIITFLNRQYFLSFLYTFLYKDISFLTFLVWNGFNKIPNGERYILKNFKRFLKTLVFKKYGILGFKILLKGKLFKRRRKKKIYFKKGSIKLLNLNKDVKFINYDVFTRLGTYNFKCWVVFI